MDEGGWSHAPTSGGTIAFRDEGQGPAVLLVHGFPTSSYLWRREVPLLGSRMRVIAPDLLGYGASERPMGVDLSETAQVTYLREVLQTIGVDRVAVVGHDVGGALAQMLALDGERPAVEALVLVDSACFDAWPSELVRQVQAVRPEDEGHTFVEEQVRRVWELGTGHPERRGPAALEGYLAPWSDDPGSFFRAARGVEGKGLAGREDELANLDVPAFLIWGEDDPFVPPELAERLQEALPGSTLALLPGCSHLVMDDAPRTVGPLVYEFLRTRYAGDSRR